MSAQSNRRSAPGRPFRPGQSGNPGGRPKALPGFTARAKELSIPVLENMAKIATTGRGPAAVQAGALVLAYGEGKPVERVDLTARRAPDGVGGDPDAARQRLEALIAREAGGALPEGSATVPQTVAHRLGGSENPSNDGPVADGDGAETADRDQVVAKAAEEGDES